MAPRSTTRLTLLTVPLTLGLALAGAAAAVQPESTAESHPGPAPRVETAADLPDGAVVANEKIYQLQRAGDRVYAMGYFDSVGRYGGPGAALSVLDGQPTPSPQISDGQVSVSVKDGAGGWFLGGDFTRIGGHEAGGLAHVLADGSLDTAFLPKADHLVSAMALAGDTLYVGGAFTTIDGVTRERLAALSTADGSIQAFDEPQPSRVTELELRPPGDGPALLYVASDKLTAVDLTTGATVPGFTAPAGSPITALELGGDRLYVGRTDVVALDPDTGGVDNGFHLATPEQDDSARLVHTLLYTADRLYIGADRRVIDGRPGRLVAVDPATGALDAGFAPDITIEATLPYLASGVYDLALDGDHLWAGGSFAGGLAVVDATTGASVDLGLPSYNLQVNAVEQSGGDVYVGGHFYMSDWERTRGLAAFDAATLDPVPGFHANTNTYGDLFVGAGAVWIAPTHFYGYDPDAEHAPYYSSWTSDVVAFDPDTGARIPERSMKVKNLTGVTTIGDRLYVARRLQNDVPMPRNRITVYDTSGKLVDAWTLKPRGYITQLTSIGHDLVVAGSFIGSRSYWTSGTSLLRVNPGTGRPRDYFDPHLNGPVYDVAASRGGLIATGLFTKVQDVFAFFGKRPGMSRMSASSHSDGTFAPKPFEGNRVLVQVHPLGDLLWVSGSPRSFLDAATGKPVADPIGWDGYPVWVTGTADDLTYTSGIMPNLGGRTGFKLGFVANAG